jgi:hypothetical protein
VIERTARTDGAEERIIATESTQARQWLWDAITAPTDTNNCQITGNLGVTHALFSCEQLLKYFERIAWMMGDERGYDAEEFKTKFYPQGHFNKPFLHMCRPSTHLQSTPALIGRINWLGEEKLTWGGEIDFGRRNWLG